MPSFSANPADLLVAGVAIVLGCLGLAAATNPLGWPQNWSVARGVLRIAGPFGLRLFLILVGILMIAIGVSLL